MRPTEQLAFVFPSDRIVGTFQDWFWHQCRRPADKLTRNCVTVSVFSHGDRIAAIERAAALNGQIVHEEIQPH